MTTNLHCGNAVHAAIAADPAWFAKQNFLGYQVVEADQDSADPVDHVDDVSELRRCACCGTTIGRSLGIGALMLEAIRITDQSPDGVALLYRCKAALRGDEQAIRSCLVTLEMQRMMALPVPGSRPRTTGGAL